MFYRWLLKLLGLMVMGWLAAVPAAGAAEPIRVGVTLGLSGKYQPMATMSERGFRLWEARVNADGGILGRPVEVVVHDDGSDPQRAAALYERMIVEERVDLLLGPYSSAITKAMMPVAERHGYPILAAGAASDELWRQGYRHLFGVFIPASRYSVGFLEMAAVAGLEGVAIVGSDDLFDRVIADGSREWAGKFGLEVRLLRNFSKGERDLTGLAREIAAAKVQAVVVCGHFDESVEVRRALAAVGYRPPAYFATVGPAMDRYREELGEEAEGVFSSSQWEARVRYSPDDHALFLEPFRARFGLDPSYHAADAFAAGQILAQAVHKVGSLDRARIRDQLATMNVMSVIGRYGVDKNGLQIKHFAINTQWQKGRREIVWPEELATAKPLFHPPSGE